MQSDALTLNRSLRQSFGEILQNEGWFGLWAGFVPKLLCELSCLVVSSTTIYLVNKYIICNKNKRQSMGGFIQFVCSSVMYPLQVVSTCMAVSGSRVKAGRPPHMPIYTSWTMCWRELYSAGEHKRGSSLFWRYDSIISTRARLFYDYFSHLDATFRRRPS